MTKRAKQIITTLINEKIRSIERSIQSCSSKPDLFAQHIKNLESKISNLRKTLDELVALE